MLHGFAWNAWAPVSLVGIAELYSLDFPFQTREWHSPAFSAFRERLFYLPVPLLPLLPSWMRYLRLPRLAPKPRNKCGRLWGAG